LNILLIYVLKKKDYTLVQVTLRRIIELNPNNYSFLIFLGGACSILSNLNGALYCYRLLLKKRPQFEEIWFAVSMAYYRQEKYLKAIEAYDRAIRLNPDKKPYFTHMANIYYRKGEYWNALEFYKFIVEEWQCGFDIWNILGELFMLTRQYDNAIDAYGYALSFERNYYTMYELSKLYINGGCYTKAAELLKKIVESYKANPRRTFNDITKLPTQDPEELLKYVKKCQKKKIKNHRDLIL